MTIRRVAVLMILALAGVGLAICAEETPAPGAITGSATGSTAGGEALHARAFTIRYRNPSDAAALVEPILSREGSYTLQPRLNTLTVQDTDQVLGRVEELIRSFDVPPRNVEVTINLLIGTRQPSQQQPLPREIRGITEVLPDITRWSNYQLLDSVSFTGSEGAVTSRTLTGEGEKPDGYRIEVGIQSVDEENGVITVNPFVVQKDYRGDSAVPVWRPVYSTKLNLRQNRILTIGAASSEKSEKAVFLTILARVTE